MARIAPNTRNRIATAAVTGLPGRPNRSVPSPKRATSTGLPGRIRTPWTSTLAPRSSTVARTRSLVPIDTPAVVTTISAGPATIRASASPSDRASSVACRRSTTGTPARTAIAAIIGPLESTCW